MIHNFKTLKVFDGNTCYCGTDSDPYDLTQVVMSRDMAWEVVQELLAALRSGDEEVSVRFYEEVKD